MAEKINRSAWVGVAGFVVATAVQLVFVTGDVPSAVGSGVGTGIFLLLLFYLTSDA